MLTAAPNTVFGKLLLIVLLVAVLGGSYTMTNVTSLQAQDIPLCTITVGGGGESETYSAFVSGNSVWEFPSVLAREFIRSTTGPCTFTVYNQENFSGRYVTLGTGLDDRIRAGIDGVENRDGGGGDTWRIRAIRIEVVRDFYCTLRIGGNGVRMTYFTGIYQVVPAMNRVSWFAGQNPIAPGNNGVECAATLHESTFFGGWHDVLSPFPDDGSPHDPGFRARSIEIEWLDSPPTPTPTPTPIPTPTPTPTLPPPVYRLYLPVLQQ